MPKNQVAVKPSGMPGCPIICRCPFDHVYQEVGTMAHAECTFSCTGSIHLTPEQILHYVDGADDPLAWRKRRGLTRTLADEEGLSESERELWERGLSDRGLTEKGLTERGLHDRGLTERGLTERGLTERGLTARELAEEDSLADTSIIRRLVRYLKDNKLKKDEE
jgi:hypothetical protein